MITKYRIKIYWRLCKLIIAALCRRANLITTTANMSLRWMTGRCEESLETSNANSLNRCRYLCNHTLARWLSAAQSANKHFWTFIAPNNLLSNETSLRRQIRVNRERRTEDENWRLANFVVVCLNLSYSLHLRKL